MKISEAAERAGVSPQNIRFYEKQGLLSPDRMIINRYRTYEAADICRLKEIRLLRKLGISISEIRLMQQGLVSVPALLAHREQELATEQTQAREMQTLCAKMRREQRTSPTMDADSYLSQIERLEQGNGAHFNNILEDFKTKARALKDKMPDYRAFVFEPQEPVLRKQDFTLELMRWAQAEGKELTVLRESMMPLIELDGKKYMGQLELPRFVDLPFPLSAFFMNTRTFGFRFVYLYRYDDDDTPASFGLPSAESGVCTSGASKAVAD